MSISVKASNGGSVSSKYPYIGEIRNVSAVLFTSKDAGVFLRVSSNSKFKVGEYYSSFKEVEFTTTQEKFEISSP